MLDFRGDHAWNRVVCEPEHIVIDLDVQLARFEMGPSIAVADEADSLQLDFLVARR